MEYYTINGKIGEGAHGLVMKGRHKQTGRVVALKKVVLKNVNDQIPLNIFREIQCLKHTQNKYIVELLDVFAHGPSIVLVFEYTPSGLWEILRDTTKPLTIPVIKTYTWMLLQGVQHLHNIRIMHRDLKPANLLITESGCLKIADFGLARLFFDDVSIDNESNSGDSDAIVYNENRRQFSHQVATRWYRSPELLYGARIYTHAVDLWAVGCIIGEMHKGSPVFPGETDIEQLAIIIKSLGTPTDETWPDLKSLADYNKIRFPTSPGFPWNKIINDEATPEVLDFLQSFLQYNANSRITAKQALAHPYFHTKPLKAPMSLMPKPKDGHRKTIANTQPNGTTSKTLVPE